MKKFFFDLNRNIATTSRLKTVCFEETYGRHILRKVIANYPITPDDLENENLPEDLLSLKDKLFGLTIEPTRLSEIRYERFPNSKYATMENCKYEVKAAEILMQKYNIQFLSTTNKSIEEIASSLLQKINPETVTSTTY